MTGYQSKKAAAQDKVTEPADEPVACPYCHNSHTLGAVYFDQNCVECVKRMARSQPKREWVGLTDEEIQEIALEVPIDAVRITEAKLKEKNT